MRSVGGVDAVAQPLSGSAVLGGDEQIALDLDVLEHALAEGDEALARRCAGAERRGTADEALLQAALALVEQRAHQTAAIAEVAEQRPLADAGSAGDLVHRHALSTALGDERFGGGEDRGAIARSIGPLVPDRLGHRQPPLHDIALHLGNPTWRDYRTTVHLC